MICEVKYISNSKEIRKIGPVRMWGARVAETQREKSMEADTILLYKN